MRENSFVKEVKMLSALKHENVIGFLGYTLEPALLIVMEFAQAGTLEDFLKEQDPEEPLSHKIVLNILIGLARGLAYCHSRSPLPVIHRDIKSENVLLTNGLVPKLADLGEARAADENGAMTMGKSCVRAFACLRERACACALVCAHCTVLTGTFSSSPRCSRNSRLHGSRDPRCSTLRTAR